MNKPTKEKESRNIVSNRKAFHDYFIESRFEAGMMLEGWEVKSIRSGHVQLKDSYIVIKNGEAWILGAHITPLKTASTHISPDPMRTRKLLLHDRELNKLIEAKERLGYTLIAIDLHWKHNRVKAEIAIAKGKKQYDKRETEKRREWEREKKRVLKR